MDEVKKPEETPEKKPEEQQPEAPTILKRAEEVAEKLKDPEFLKIIERAERLQARDILGGQSTVEQPQEKHQLTPKEYKDLVMSGRIPDETTKPIQKEGQEA